MALKHPVASAKADGSDDNVVQPGDGNDDDKWDLPISLGGYTVLTNVGTAYDAIDATQGLGMVHNDWTGVTELIVVVRCKQVGTGALTWELFNDTDGVSIGTIADANNTAWHTRTGTFTTSLPTGLKTLRLRVKSSVSTDDPVYAGATLLARRTT